MQFRIQHGIFGIKFLLYMCLLIFKYVILFKIKLAQHSLSCLFGTFLCNTLKERVENSVFERTFSVWPFLSGPMYRNPLYVANKERVITNSKTNFK